VDKSLEAASKRLGKLAEDLRLSFSGASGACSSHGAPILLSQNCICGRLIYAGCLRSEIGIGHFG